MKQKSNIDKFIDFHYQYKEVLKRVEDAIEIVESSYSFKLLSFYNEFERKIIKDFIKLFPNVYADFSTKINNSESSRLVVIHESYRSSNYQATKLYKVGYNHRYAQLEHRDLLGVLMNQNIQRALIGDIVSVDNNIYFEIANHLDVIINDINKIKNVSVKIEESKTNITRVQLFIENEYIIKSYRLDNIICAITKLSREQGKQLITTGLIKVNHQYTSNYSQIILTNDIISIKGYGRYIIIINQARLTKKGNTVISTKKYK